MTIGPFLPGAAAWIPRAMFGDWISDEAIVAYVRPTKFKAF